MLYKIISIIISLVQGLGYIGIILLMTLESSFFPFPSEIVIPPAGYLAAQGKMSLFIVIICGIIGSLLGAYLNYFIALKFGRPFIIKYGEYFLLSPHRFEKIEKFFNTHGEITTFVGRLIPGIRQYISFPAGIVKMNLFKFTVFTALGAGIWVVILGIIGYWVGNNKELVKKYSHNASILLIIFCIGLILWYYKKGDKK